jgi:site-specific DNA-methyltransferase (adenine-specific)
MFKTTVGTRVNLELNHVYNMDCMEGMAQIPDKYFELAIVDPPYGIGIHEDNPIENPSDKNNHEAIRNSYLWDKTPPSNEYFIELQRISKEQIIWGGNYFLDILGYCKAPIIWDKLNGASLYADGEMAWTSSGLPRNLKIFRHQWCGAFKDSERGAVRIHRTQKPIALYKWLLANYAKPGDKILDTHVGSGSSIIACIDMGFEYMGFEIDADYYGAMQDRIYHFTRQRMLLDE